MFQSSRNALKDVPLKRKKHLKKQKDLLKNTRVRKRKLKINNLKRRRFLRGVSLFIFEYNNPLTLKAIMFMYSYIQHIGIINEFESILTNPSQINNFPMLYLNGLYED